MSLYVITSYVRDDVEDKEGLHQPEVYTTKEAANKAAKKLIRRLGMVVDDSRDFDDEDEEDYWWFSEHLDEEGLYRGWYILVTHPSSHSSLTLIHRKARRGVRRT